MKVRMINNENTKSEHIPTAVKTIQSTITIRVKTENELDLISYENFLDDIEKAIEKIPFDPSVKPDVPEEKKEDISNEI